MCNDIKNLHKNLSLYATNGRSSYTFCKFLFQFKYLLIEYTIDKIESVNQIHNKCSNSKEHTPKLRVRVAGTKPLQISTDKASAGKIKIAGKLRGRTYLFPSYRESSMHCCYSSDANEMRLCLPRSLAVVGTYRDLFAKTAKLTLCGTQYTTAIEFRFGSSRTDRRTQASMNRWKKGWGVLAWPQHQLQSVASPFDRPAMAESYFQASPALHWGGILNYTAAVCTSIVGMVVITGATSFFCETITTESIKR